MKFRRVIITSLLVICILGVAFSYMYLFQQTSTFENHDVTEEESVKNIILMIGDGMGVGQITVARYSLGLGKNLTMDSFPYKGLVTTHSLTNLVTDSAAAATALATGHKTGNGIIAMTIDGKVLHTILELAESKGKSTGLVTTTRITHATPAAFAAHVMSRNQEYEIAQQMLEKDIEVLFGGGRKIFTNLLSVAENEGYTVIENRSQLLTLNVSKVNKALGLFAESHMSYELERNTLIEPSLAEMTNISLQVLSKNENGFFLMVEGGRIDHACHANDLNNTIGETLSFDAAVKVVLQFAQRNEKTLVIVTADHETGGLVVTGSNIHNSTIDSIEVRWSTTGHTANMVPVYAYGQNASLVLAFHDNTDIGKFLFTVYGQKVGEEKNQIFRNSFNVLKYLLT